MRFSASKAGGWPPSRGPDRGPISCPAGTCRYFTTHPPAGQVLRHTVSRNILLRCENLLFNFFPLKGKNTHNSPPQPPPPLPAAPGAGKQSRPRRVAFTGTAHCLTELPGTPGWPGASPHLPRRLGCAGLSASAPRRCPDPVLSKDAPQEACKQLCAGWDGLGSSVCWPEWT